MEEADVQVLCVLVVCGTLKSLFELVKKNDYSPLANAIKILLRYSLQLQHLKVFSNRMYFFLLRYDSLLLSYLVLLKSSLLNQLSLWVPFHSPPHVRRKKKPWWFCEITKTLDMSSILSTNIWECVPKSKRCSTLSRLAPGGLLKKCGALNLPNYCRFGCERQTKAENYTCRMENNRVGWQ